MIAFRPSAGPAILAEPDAADTIVNARLKRFAESVTGEHERGERTIEIDVENEKRQRPRIMELIADAPCRDFVIQAGDTGRREDRPASPANRSRGTASE